MTDPAFEAIDAAMASLRSYRRDKLANRKRQARAAIAQTIDACAAAQDDETFNRVMQAICTAASEKNRRLIQAESSAGHQVARRGCVKHYRLCAP